MAQSLSNVLLHLIFSTKERMPWIDENIEKELHIFIIATAARLGCYVHSINGYSDHIHLLVKFPRTLAIADLLEQLKKQSSKWIKSKDAKYKAFCWQKGYGVFSVSESMFDSVVSYIENQKEHHKKISFHDEFRKLLKLNKIDFDEEFLWS